MSSIGGKTALVAGASGIVGHRLAQRLVAQGWRVAGLARRWPTDPAIPGVAGVACDLRDATACRHAAERLPPVTHVFNATRFDHDTSTLESPLTNTEMLANLLDALRAAGHPVEHVHLVHGTKYYGSHLGPFPTPAREDAPRSLQDNFSYHQEDLVRDRSGREGWSWSATRPHAIVDLQRPVARSIPVIIGVYAAISRELGLPLCFPGTQENFGALYQFTEAALLAEAIEWMAVTPAARDNAYNVTNGDYLRWCNVWPRIAAYFDMDAGPVRTVRLAQVMADKAAVWERIARRNALAATPYDRLALWSYGDFVFTPYWDIMSSTTKLRRDGFHATLDSEDMLFAIFDDLRARRLIPPR
jgi:nucleoside-diphosphate-sugar epimerase